MKISGLQENFKNGLSVVSHIAGKKTNLPILNNIMMRAKEGNINLIATDLEIGIVCQVRGKIEKEGTYTVDSKVITDRITLLPNKKIDIEKRSGSLVIKCDNYNTNIKGQDAEDFPLIPGVNKDICLKAGVGDFKEAVSQVIFAVSNSETKMELSGVLMRFTGNSLTMTTTDSYRLAEKTIKITANPAIGDERGVIVPAKTLSEVNRVLSVLRGEDLGGDDNSISFYIADSQIMFKMGGAEIISRIIEGQYPDYKQIIPNKHETRIVIDKSELIRAVKTSSIFSKSGINDINLDFPAGKNRVIVSSTSGQTGENTAELAADVRGRDNGIVVNFRYLLDGLSNINSENVVIEIINGNTPCVLRPEKEDGYLYIIMPIKQ